MKRFLLLVFSFAFAFSVKAQQMDNASAMQLVTKNADAIGLKKEDLGNLVLSSTYFNAAAGTQMVYLYQSYKGLPIYNQMLVLAFKNETLVSNAGNLLGGMEARTSNQSPSPGLQAVEAVRRAFTEVGLPQPSQLYAIRSMENGRKLDFGKVNTTKENVTAELIWVPVGEGATASVKLAWQVQMAPIVNADFWMMRIDAAFSVCPPTPSGEGLGVGAYP